MNAGSPSPELEAAAREDLERYDAQREFLTRGAWKWPVLTLTLVLLGGIFVGTALVAWDLRRRGLVTGQEMRVAVLFGETRPNLLATGEIWRWTSALLLHASASHLVLNGICIWLFGRLLEPRLGLHRALVLFFVPGIVGSVASTWWTGRPSVGASGIAFGLVGASLAFGFRFGPSAQRARLAAIAGALVLVALWTARIQPQLDHAAHAAGLLTGVLLGATTPTLHRARRAAPPWLRVVGWLLLSSLFWGAFQWAAEAWSCSRSTATLERCIESSVEAAASVDRGEGPPSPSSAPSSAPSPNPSSDGD